MKALIILSLAILITKPLLANNILPIDDAIVHSHFMKTSSSISYNLGVASGLFLGLNYFLKSKELLPRKVNKKNFNTLKENIPILVNLTNSFKEPIQVAFESHTFFSNESRDLSIKNQCVNREDKTSINSNSINNNAANICISLHNANNKFNKIRAAEDVFRLSIISVEQKIRFFNDYIINPEKEYNLEEDFKTLEADLQTAFSLYYKTVDDILKSTVSN